MTRRMRILMAAMFHLVPVGVFLLGLSLAVDRWRFSAPDQGREADVVAMAERWPNRDGDGRTRIRDMRLSEEDYDDLIAQRVDMYPIVAFWTLEEAEFRAQVNQPLSVTPEAGPVDVGDRVAIRYDRSDPENVLIYTGFWSLWAAPVVLLAVGAIFNGLVLIGSSTILRIRF